MDSIVKNVGGSYVEEFSKSISDVFFYAYKQIKHDSKLRASYIKLLRTWPDFFGSEKVKSIETRIQQMEQGGGSALPTSRSQQVCAYLNFILKHKQNPSEKELLLQLAEKLKRQPELMNDPTTARLFTELSNKMGISIPPVTPQQPAWMTPQQPPSINPYTGNVLNVGNLYPPQGSSTSGMIGFMPQPQSKNKEPGVHRLYDALTKQCMNCGVRFGEQRLLSKHLDVHQKRNQFFRTNKDLSRKWYPVEDEWLKMMDDDQTSAIQCPGAIIFGDKTATASETSTVNQGTISSLVVSAADFFASTNKPVTTVQSKVIDRESVIVANTEQDVCPICHEGLDKFYDEDRDEWMLRGAVFDEGLSEYVHRFCSSSINKRKNEAASTELASKKLKY